MADIATLRHHADQARAARANGDGKEAAHQVRNAGAVLAQIQAEASVAKPVRPRCESCGRRSIGDETSRPSKDKATLRNARQEFRELKRELGVDAVAAPASAVDNEGRQFGYGLKVLDKNPN